MKALIRIFNLIILALAAAATSLLFIMPTLSFNSNIAVDIVALAKFIPETEYTSAIDVVNSLGTDTIHVGVKFSISMSQANRYMTGDRDVINAELLNTSIDDVLTTLDEPVKLITEYTVKSVLKNILKTEITNKVRDAIEEYKEKNPDKDVHSTAEEMMESVGMDDAYFADFVALLYTVMKPAGAELNDVTTVMYNQIDEALALADESGIVDSSDFSETTKDDITNSLLTSLNQLKLMNDDGHSLKGLENFAYITLTEYLKTELTSRVSDPTTLEQMFGEPMQKYASRMLGIYISIMLPGAFYQIVGYVCLAMFIGTFVFAAIWAILFFITLFKTLTKKPWTIFGPWFWIIGSIQLVIGVALTVFGKFILPTINVSTYGIPLKSVILAIRTSALIPSLIFAGCILFAIVYAVFRSIAKNEDKPKKDLKVTLS